MKPIRPPMRPWPGRAAERARRATGRAWLLSGFIAVLLGAVATGAVAETVYKCVTPGGSVAFQDQPCPTTAKQSQVRLATPPPAAAPAPAAAASTGASVSIASGPVSRPSEPHRPLPPLWVCQNAEDGSTYVSRNGSPPVRYVPLGVLGYPGTSLGKAYAPGGIGVSAPGMRQIPIDRSPAAAAAAEYTPLQDRCVRASRAQTCVWLRREYDRVDEKLRHARFNDERAALQPQADKLDAELDGC